LNLARILLIVAALAVAGVTAYLVKGYLQGKEAEIAENGKKNEVEQTAKVEVLVALNDLPAGTIVNPDLFRWQTWPEDGLSPEYVVRGGSAEKAEGEKAEAAAKPEDFTGWAVRRGLAAGEPVTKKRLLEPGKAGFLAGVLGPGMRAVSIGINAETGAAGFILPGDRVDVVLTQQIRQTDGEDNNRDKVISETVIDDVRVLAVDQTFNDIEEQTRVGKTITMELSPKQAEGLAVAKRMGRISLSLRSLVRDAKVEMKSAFTSDEEVSRFLRGRPSTVPRVLVAKQKLPAGTLLRDTDMTWQQLAPGDTGEGKIFEALTSTMALRGSFLKSTVEMHAAILHENIIRPAEQGFIVASLAPGMRAVSMAVSQVSSVSGFVSPGDKVDLLLTHQVEDTSDNPVLTPRKFSETILKDLRLLAIEQIIDAATGKPQVGTTVTLEVSPREAEIVALAASMGDLSLSLRSVPADDGSEDSAREMDATSDVQTSQALLDQLILGTKRDPSLLQRRRQLNRSRPKRAKPTSAAVPSPVPPIQAQGEESKSITIYRAANPTTVVLER
jgi:pilus assembly protein CpaB